MNESDRFKYFLGFAQAEKSHRLSVLRRSRIRGLVLSTIIVLLFAVTISSAIMAQEDFDGVYDRASICFRQGKYQEALGLYQKANRIKQNSNLECLWGIAQTFSKLGAHKNALQTCDRLIQVSGNNKYFCVTAWNMRGNELSAAATANPGRIDEEKLREAEAAYREVLKLNASNMAHYNLGITLIRLNRINEGIGELKTYIQHAEEEDIAEKARKIIQDPRRAVENFAPDFSIITADGEYISSDELRGKVLLIDFWGAWCKPCLNAIPFLSQTAKKYRKEEFVLISVDVNDDDNKWREFIAHNNMAWTQTRDGNTAIQRIFQVIAFPTYILIDHEGIIRYRGVGSGPQTESEVTERIKKTLKLLAASPNRQKGKSAETAADPALQPVPAPHRDSGSSGPAPSAFKPDMVSPKA